ncbi:hypothetical protein CC80DRAFT_156157 [Byssothecium circinans]|uniref:Uncharacterized protein n=1 Tax=Byssothecium circinans TaxID=147558 RepID=A0A6A5UAG3_9PLEO|nr:hypothetical protein CC80DRAFT_156157 [Byssothecium circinans]
MSMRMISSPLCSISIVAQDWTQTGTHFLGNARLLEYLLYGGKTEESQITSLLSLWRVAPCIPLHFQVLCFLFNPVKERWMGRKKGFIIRSSCVLRVLLDGPAFENDLLKTNGWTFMLG